MYEQFKELADVDITAGPMEVGPTTHYIMGGVRVDAETGATTRPGLFAVGEVSGGMHGANRLGGNSLSDLLVFGQRAGAAAAVAAAKETEVAYLDPTAVQAAATELAAPLEPGTGEDPHRLHEELQELMQTQVGIFRTEEDLDAAIARLGEFRARWPALRIGGGRAYNPGWGLVYELRNMLIVAEAIARSAKQRHESRGAHSRIDYPDADDAWATLNSVVRLAGDTMEVGTTPLPALSDELRQLITKE
jgi:succinate dehydrogenase / fumarate reductase flavoprotein subunit